MKRVGWLASVIGLVFLLPACSSDSGSGSSPTSASQGETGTGDSGTFGTSDPSDTTPTQSTSSGTDSADDGCNFVCMPDGGGGAIECDPKAQDCPDGSKCTAWANDGGGFWNANKCVEVMGDGVTGDACMVQGGATGIDDCAKGYICMLADMDGIGVCVEFCDGESEMCEDPQSICAIYNDGVLPICLVSCDPLLQDCPMGQECIDTPNGNFICFTDASGDAGADGDPCPPADGENSCDPGMWCGPGSFNCVDINCCTPYCDLTDPMPCTSPDECISFYGDQQNAPPQYTNVGVCVLP